MWGRSGFRTADPAADLAVLYGLHPHLPVYPERRLAQRYLDLHLDVSPAARRARGRRAEEGAAEAAVAEESLEDVLEAAEGVPTRVTAGAPRGTWCP